MKRGLRILSTLLALGVIATWLALGAGRGWTKTSKEVKTLDEITGIEGITHQKGFWPGVDFLGAGLLGAGLLAGASLLFRSSSQSNQ